VNRYIPAVLPFDLAVADFVTDVRQFQTHTLGVDLDHGGNRMDEVLSAGDQNVLQVERLKDGGRIVGVDPAALQDAAEAGLRKSRHEQSVIEAPMGETDLDAVILKMDEVQAVDKELTRDPLVCVVGVKMAPPLGGFDQEFFFLKRDFCRKSGAGFGKGLGPGGRVGFQADLVQIAFREFHCQSPQVSEVNQRCHQPAGRCWETVQLQPVSLLSHYRR
jgi:hypothetical protein